MADALVTEILKKLGSMLLQEMGLVWGMKDELEKIRNTVSTIRAVLLDAEEQQATNHEVEDWLEKLNDAFHDADDLLDDFSTQVLHHQVITQNTRLMKVRNFFSSSNKLPFSSKLAHEIKAIRERLDAIAEDRKKFHLTELPINHMRVENTKREETHSLVHAENFIGRDVDKMEIVQLLLESNIQDQNVSVVALLGIGGLGKTTLAQLVYNDERVIKHFDLKMWVCVSDIFDVKLIAEKIIGSATGETPENLLMDKLQELLSKEINGKKYLLVLDDVWNENRDKWLKLVDLLMGGARGSKILITTRSELVANVTGTNSPYFIKGLSKEDSWSLFEKMAFKQGKESENTFQVTIGKEIVQKCKGVPLAIRAIGSLLYTKDTDDEWLLFKKNDLSKIAEEEDVIFPILKFSYDYLPSDLKRCFAFCSLYLKDQTINKQKLIQLWMAEGFIRPVYENQQLEDVGDSYFMDLLRRSLFQDVQRDEWGDVISCKMHDLVHDLAQLVAKAKFFTANLNVENVNERTRHVSLDSGVNSSRLVRANKLRTFFLNAKNIKIFSNVASGRILSTFKRLRVLDLHSVGIEIVPSYISKLKHLRYLDLSENHIKTLPNFITKLQNLQTLKLNQCSCLEELPSNFTKLVSLRHLELDKNDALIRMPNGFSQLTCLLTLTLFVADSNSQLNELQCLNNLRGKLKVVLGRCDSSGSMCLKKASANGLIWRLDFRREKEDDGEELLLEALRPHPNLKELEIIYYWGVSFPSWMMVIKIGLSLPHLVRIYMSKCKGWKHLPPFGQLPSLQFLSVCEMESLNYIDNSTGHGHEENQHQHQNSLPSSLSGAAARRRESTPTSKFFPSLKELELSNLPKLKGWWRSTEAEEEATTTTTSSPAQRKHHQLPSFPSLSKLTIDECPNLASVPLLQPYLETLVLYVVNKNLVQQQLMMMVSPTTVATSSSSSSLLLPLFKLKSLSLIVIEDLVTLPEESFRSLTSLQKLVISYCPKLTSLSGTLRHLTALNSLSIQYCQELDLLDDDDGMQFQGLKSLTDLYFRRVPKLISLPAGLQHVTTLQQLDIECCDNFMALPEWIDNLTSLERLSIYYNPKLTSLPKGLHGLTALQQLKITSCAQVLYDRCLKETGEDWPKIAHIPYVHISPGF
ncbi:putative disease resistance protein RGA4 [Cornus florida]|uniref:putative disease resistance protein RGA4 n=1 Tax=Cornus florida TaxID=4283 RepID=UPI00289DB7D4|nr:putative disease resistance protein RGA4 [Cornus florida]XP_059656010.1 putative disease resistance protein RGA4 [Cornus florida]XP_059656017.1 putative disease resistance protein RGA4 [Cornus florida]XP_059656024.1 putative disease resistance protein RGA4 [Cornus florida]XP_059656033.1 putative disease resistance protein RGA4 [Cornus florida]XP_059656042.1 putative disease resistance protein RGA4 [Cornus florida]XP_059656049.1 putative disease resistance protein RGA4 [Cornus florida]XP_0